MLGYSLAGLIALFLVELVTDLSITVGEYVGNFIVAFILSIYQCYLARYYLIEIYEDRLVSANVRVSGPARSETILAKEIHSLARSRIFDDLIVLTKSGDSIRFPRIAYKRDDFKKILRAVENMYNNSSHSAN